MPTNNTSFVKVPHAQNQASPTCHKDFFQQGDHKSSPLALCYYKVDFRHEIYNIICELVLFHVHKFLMPLLSFPRHTSNL